MQNNLNYLRTTGLFLKSLAVLWMFFNLNKSWAQPGRQLFDDTYVHKIEIVLPDIAWEDSLYERKQRSFNSNTYETTHIYTLGSITVDGQRIDSVGIRFKGEISFGQTFFKGKAPLKIDFNEFVKGKKYDGLKKINLHNLYNDPSRIREKLLYDLLSDLGLRSVRCAYTEVWVNNELRGLYNIVEQIDKTYLENNHGTKKGNLYKCQYGSIFLAHRDTSGGYPVSYPPYRDYPKDVPLEYYQNTFGGFEKKTNENLNDWSDLYSFEAKLSEDSLSPQFKYGIETVFDLERALKIFSFNVISQTNDQDYGITGNYYLYGNPNTNRIEWIPWDYNQSMSLASGHRNDSIKAYSIFMEPGPGFGHHSRFMFWRLIANPDIRQQYALTACEVLKVFDSTRVYAQIDTLANLIRDAVHRDPYPLYPSNAFESNKDFQKFITSISTYDSTVYYEPGVKAFVRDQNIRVRNQLAIEGVACGGFVLATDLTVSPQVLNLIVNDNAHISTQFIPSNSSLTGLVWYSEDPSIAEIEQTGDVEAKSVGTTRIVVATTDGTIVRFIDVSVSQLNDIARGERNSISVAPNPVQDHLGIVLDNYFNQIDVDLFDISGKHLLHHSTGNTSRILLSMESFASGMYWVKVRAGVVEQSFKIIRE